MRFARIQRSHSAYGVSAKLWMGEIVSLTALIRSCNGVHSQDVMNGIAGDILQQRNHRVNRQRELAQLAATKRKLDAKTRHYEETVDYYRRYVQACLANLASTSKSRRKSLSAGQPQQLLVGDVARHRPLK